MPPRQDSGNASAHRAFANLKVSIATDKRRISNFDTSHVGNRVKFPRRALKWNADIPRTDLLALGCRSRRRRLLRLATLCVDCEQEQEHEHGRGKAFRCHFRSINYQLPTINFSV